MQRIWILLLILLTLVLSACQSAAPSASEKGVEPATGGQVTSSGDSVTIKSASGETATFSGQAPDELKAFPVPGGFALTTDGYGSMTTQQGTVATATWLGKGSVKEAAAFYASTMSQQGWTQTMAIDSGSSRVFTYEKGDNSAWLTIDEDQGGTRIGVLYGKQAGGTAPNTLRSQVEPTSARVNVVPTAVAPVAVVPEATSKPEMPALTDASVLPAELRAVPLATGFGVVKGSTQRIAEGGAFRMATARALGTSAVTDVEQFYKRALAAEWNLEGDIQSEGECELTFTNRANDALGLTISIQEADVGTEVSLLLTATE